MLAERKLEKWSDTCPPETGFISTPTWPGLCHPRMQSTASNSPCGIEVGATLEHQRSKSHEVARSRSNFDGFFGSKRRLREVATTAHKKIRPRKTNYDLLFSAENGIQLRARRYEIYTSVLLVCPVQDMWLEGGQARHAAAAREPHRVAIMYARPPSFQVQLTHVHTHVRLMNHASSTPWAVPAVWEARVVAHGRRAKAALAFEVAAHTHSQESLRARVRARSDRAY